MVKGIKPSPPRQIVNKGSWTEEEDQILSNYISIHGDKKWRSVPAKAGLNRCGKSCRLRWLNYLRPGIIRGNISEDEEDLIIRLHNLLGNSISLPIDGHRISLPIDGHRISLPNCAIQGDAVQFTRIMAFKKYNRTPRALGIHENQLLNQRVQYLQIKNCLPDENRTDHLSNIWKRWWSLIAGRLPGRTDNEIKNHWNTHLSKKSLSITDLNMKQNQNLEANPNLFPPMASARIQVFPETKPDMDEISRRQDNFPSTKNAEISKPWSQLLKTDLATDRNQFVDVDEFFNFQESDMPETNTLSGEESRIREEQPQFKEFRVDEIYQNLLNDELLGSSDGCSEEQNKYEPLDLDSWAKLLDYDGNDDMLISFS